MDFEGWARTISLLQPREVEPVKRVRIRFENIRHVDRYEQSLSAEAPDVYYQIDTTEANNTV